MQVTLPRWHRAFLLGALILAASPPVADGKPTGTKGPSGSRRQLVVQVRGSS
jgi:hypothetical protein